jgi:hypothetical protein
VTNGIPLKGMLSACDQQKPTEEKIMDGSTNGVPHKKILELDQPTAPSSCNDASRACSCNDASRACSCKDASRACSCCATQLYGSTNGVPQKRIFSVCDQCYNQWEPAEGNILPSQAAAARALAAEAAGERAAAVAAAAETMEGAARCDQ